MTTMMAGNEGFGSPLLARYKPLTCLAIAHTSTKQLPALEVRLDPICSRSCLTRWTLGQYFPAQLKKTFPNRPPSRSMFEGSPPIRGYDCVTILLELRDVEEKRVKFELQLRICEESEGSKVLNGRIVLGKDVWERADVEAIWPAVKKKEGGVRWTWKGNDEEEFLGVMIGKQKVKFGKTVQAKS